MLRKKVNSNAGCGQEKQYTRNLVSSNKAVLIIVTYAYPLCILIVQHIMHDGETY